MSGRMLRSFGWIGILATGGLVALLAFGCMRATSDTSTGLAIAEQAAVLQAGFAAVNEQLWRYREAEAQAVLDANLQSVALNPGQVEPITKSLKQWLTKHDLDTRSQATNEANMGSWFARLQRLAAQYALLGQQGQAINDQLRATIGLPAAQTAPAQP